MTMPGNIQLPLALAEQARTFLAWLGQYSTIPDAQRNEINEWVDQYNAKVLRYIHERYGHYAMIMANELSKQVGEEFVESMNRSCHKAQQDMFDRLEAEMRDDLNGQG